MVLLGNRQGSCSIPSLHYPPGPRGFSSAHRVQLIQVGHGTTKTVSNLQCTHPLQKFFLSCRKLVEPWTVRALLCAFLRPGQPPAQTDQVPFSKSLASTNSLLDIPARAAPFRSASPIALASPDRIRRDVGGTGGNGPSTLDRGALVRLPDACATGDIRKTSSRHST